MIHTLTQPFVLAAILASLFRWPSLTMWAIFIIALAVAAAACTVQLYPQLTV
jgi:hypothetical protein